MDQIAALLTNKDGDVRRAAWLFFSECSTEECSAHMEQIGALLSDKDGDVQEAAVTFFK